ncbi:MAG: transposase [Pseudonocardiaceae bacterium]
MCRIWAAATERSRGSSRSCTLAILWSLCRRDNAFHVVAWATEALDQVRRQMVNRLRAAGHNEEAAELKGSRWTLRTPPNLTGDQRTTLPGQRRTLPSLPAQLREIFACRDVDTAKVLLGRGSPVPNDAISPPSSASPQRSSTSGPLRGPQLRRR